MAELLVDAETGIPLPLVAGDIDAPAPIPFDWTVDLTNRAAFEHLCNVVADPPLEFNVLRTIPASLKVSPDPFEDHSPDSDSPIVFLPQDLDVRSLPQVDTDTQARATKIELFGAELQTVSGRPFTITATADVPGPGRFGVTRTKKVHIPTVDHVNYAQSRADDLAQQEAAPPLSLTAEINEFDEETAEMLGVSWRPPFDVGDWVYAYKPEAGLRGGDDTATTIEGETVFPRRMRVL